MSLRRKVTGILAWAGLAIVIAVPAAETVSSKLLPADNGAAVVDVKAPKTAALVAPLPAIRPAAATNAATVQVRPVATPAVAEVTPPVAADAAPAGSDRALQEYLRSGKKLPDYITTGSAHPAAANAAAPAQSEPASLPVPAAAETVSVAAAPTATDSAMTTAQPDASNAAQPAAPPLPKPVKARPKPVQPQVTEADLKDWKSGSLEDYLRQHGLLSGADDSQSSGN